MDPLHSEAIHSERPIRIICIGAGASGLLLAYKLQRSFRRFELTIFEKNSGVSGTWLENRYPGCACDVPAHNYTYSFEPKHDWSRIYAGSEEISQYFEDFKEKYELGRFIRLRHQVTEAQWLDADGLWQVEVTNLEDSASFRDTCHILINASGYLNTWAWPDIAGLSDFEGQLVHSANWNDETELQGKNVALVGNGPSAVQLLPEIQSKAHQLTTFMRSPLWVLPTIGDGQRVYSAEEIQHFRKTPEALLRVRKLNEAVVNSIFSVYLSNSILQEQSKIDLANGMRRAIKNEAIEAKLIPEWGVGCRRLTPGVGYLEALLATNVQIVHEGVVELTKEGCKTSDGAVYPMDVIICATGFDTSFIPRFPIRGHSGNNLQTIWKQGPSSYLGIAVSGFANYFMFLGPYSPVANGPTLAAIETQADHILALIDRYQTENIHSLTPKSTAQADFCEHVASFMKDAVYSEQCRSGHKNHTVNGRVPTLWPGSTLHYMEALRDVRADDWEVKYNGNRFAWLGNGISQTEFDPTSDLAWYIRSRDDGPYSSRRRNREIRTRSGSQPARILHRTLRPTDYNL